MVDNEQMGNVTAPPIAVEKKQTGLSRKQILGYAGAAILAIGVFMPVVSIPFYGSINYYNSGGGDGIFILILAAISAAIVYFKKYRGLAFTVIASLYFIVVDFISVQSRISGLRQQFAGNVITSAVAQSVQMEWGWAVLVFGVILLVASAIATDQN